MSKRKDIRKTVIIGSGPIVIGQAAEFDYAGTQACLALREEGYDVVLVNSNPATIMTDPLIADCVYMEPLTVEALTEIIEKERPDAILPGIGGQIGLNLVVALDEQGILAKHHVEVLGTPIETIQKAENRQKFKALCDAIGEPTLAAEPAHSVSEAKAIAEKLGYPVMLRPAFTLGGTGSGIARNLHDLKGIAEKGLQASPLHEILVEQCAEGMREIEFELLRDGKDQIAIVAGMENVDPVGIHTGDSIVVSPVLTLPEKAKAMLEKSAKHIIRELGVIGGANIQFAWEKDGSSEEGRYFVIEVNPRVSRSSALASKASGYPIALSSAKLAVGMTLDSTPLIQHAVAVKLPRFPFDKFPEMSNLLTTQMQATGEVMGLGKTLDEALQKAIRSLEAESVLQHTVRFEDWSREALSAYVLEARGDRLFALMELLKRLPSGDEELEKLSRQTQIAPLFLGAIRAAALAENAYEPTPKLYTDYFAVPEENTHSESAAAGEEKKKIALLGAGPIRIGQGIEFDTTTVHAAKMMESLGYEPILINNNPETVSTDYTQTKRLYFEPLTVPDVLRILELEKPEGVLATVGGQTALNLAGPLAEQGVTLLGTGADAIETAENRDAFAKLLESLGIPRPEGRAVAMREEAIRVAREIGYPVLARPSYVLGGCAMALLKSEEELQAYFHAIREDQLREEQPLLIDKFIAGKEVEVDAVSDGKDVFVPAIMEQTEPAGVHSGDSTCIVPPVSLSEDVQKTVLSYTKKLGLALPVRGLFNIQFVVETDAGGNDKVYVLELNPRASRTVPFVSKATGYSLADIATKAVLGISLREQGLPVLDGETMCCPAFTKVTFVPVAAQKTGERCYCAKAPVFSFDKLAGADRTPGPEMKSTGEVMGYGKTPEEAIQKARKAASVHEKDNK